MNWLLLMLAVEATEAPRNTAQAQAAYEREKAVGPLQIRPIMVADLERITGEQLDHREFRGRSISRWAFHEYAVHYGAQNEEEAAKMWHCGPDMLPAHRADVYWRRVSANMAELSGRKPQKDPKIARETAK